MCSLRCRGTNPGQGRSRRWRCGFTSVGFCGSGVNKNDAEGTCFLVVHVSGGGHRFVEVTRRANRLLAGEGDLKPGGLVPVEVTDGVRV